MNEPFTLPHADSVGRRLADELSQRVGSARVSAPPAIVSIQGEPGSGKSTILRILAQRAEDLSSPIIRISPPSAGLDASVHAIAQCAGALREHGVNGVLDSVFDPGQTFAAKVDAAKASLVSVNPAVILMDLPDAWQRGHVRTPEAQLTANQGLFALRSIAHGAYILRWPVFIASRAPLSGLEGLSVKPEALNSRSSGSAFLNGADWGTFAEHASRLSSLLGEDANALSPLSLRIAVALRGLDVQEPAVLDACRGGHAGLARLLRLELSRATPGRRQMRELWRRFGMARFPFSATFLETATASADAATKELFEHVVLLRSAEGWFMHPSMRQACGSLSPADRPDDGPELHRALAREYVGPASSARQDREGTIAWLEGLYHHAEAGDIDAIEDAPDVSYWIALGRARSLAGDFELAITAFERATALRPGHAYAQEYLGYNLDRVGRRLPHALQAFARAVQLEPDNPWWNRRHVEALLRRGRVEKAHAAWLRTLRHVRGADDPDEWLQQNLFSGVTQAFLDRGEEELAAEVVDVVPAELRCEELKALDNKIQHRRLARRLGGAFVPESIAFEEIWSRPHIDSGVEPAHWYPGRVAALADGFVTLQLAEPPLNLQEPTVFQIELSEKDFRSEASWAASRPIRVGTFLEVHVLANDERVISVHESLSRAPRRRSLDLLANWPEDAPHAAS